MGVISTSTVVPPSVSESLMGEPSYPSIQNHAGIATSPTSGLTPTVMSGTSTWSRNSAAILAGSTEAPGTTTIWMSAGSMLIGSQTMPMNSSLHQTIQGASPGWR